MTRINIDLDGLKALAEHAKRAGTQDAFMVVMFEWADQANAKIAKQGTALMEIAKVADPTTHPSGETALSCLLMEVGHRAEEALG